METVEALDQLADEPLIDLARVVANRVLPPLAATAEVVSGLPEGPIRDAAEMHRTLHEHQGHWLEALGDAVQLPHLFGLLTPGEVAARLSEAWEELR